MSTRTPSIRIAFIVLCIIVLAACGHRRAQRTIPSNWVGTTYAQLLGYFTAGRHFEEPTPAGIPHDAVRDEATLTELDGEHMCVDVVVRTSATDDEPIELLEPTCLTGRRRTGAILMSGYVSVYDVVPTAEVAPVGGGTGSAYRVPGQVVVDHVRPEQFAGANAAGPTSAYRIVERGAHLCCPNPARNDVGFTMRNRNMNNHGGATQQFTWSVE